jgi:hypothetical protein
VVGRGDLLRDGRLVRRGDDGEARPVPFTAGSAVYLAVLALLVVLGGVAFFTARNVLRVS